MKWNMAPKLFRKKEPWFLAKAEMEENLQELRNPSIGWYQIFTFPLDKPFDPEVTQTSLTPSEQLVFLMVDIGAYRIRDLDSDALDTLRRILSFFRDQGKEMILRLTYDTIGKGMEHEPTRFDQVQRHILQLAGILRAFTDHIYIIQGILVGSWGEMHNSRHLSQNRIVSILDMLNTQLDGQVFLSVRKPSHYRMVRPEEQWDVQPERSIGLFNDGIFGSASDLGTYGIQSPKEAGWEQFWEPEAELRFQELLCRTVPNGGEVVHPGEEPLPLQQTVERLKKMHISYLNSRYDRRLLDFWQSQTWGKLDAWNGMNGLDYIGRHLGYRFRVLDAKLDVSLWNGKLTVSVLIDNTGFSACYFPTKLTLIQTLPSGEMLESPLELPPAAIGSGENEWFRFAAEREESKLFLRMERCTDNRPIWFGTVAPDEKSQILLGELKTET